MTLPRTRRATGTISGVGDPERYNSNGYLARIRELGAGAWAKRIPAHRSELEKTFADELDRAEARIAEVGKQEEEVASLGTAEQRIADRRDYKTGKFRGWLCHACNTGMGSLGDNEFGLQRALMYLARAELG